jgi:hypothetical protein
MAVSDFHERSRTIRVAQIRTTPEGVRKRSRTILCVRRTPRREARPQARARRIGVGLAAVALLGTAHATPAAHERPGAYWQTWQAESISTIRGMHVRALECRGLGRALTDGGVRRYRRFRCVAGTRAPWETYDTIAVFYVLRPLGPYVGARSRQTLTQVHFIGGPGIP